MLLPSTMLVVPMSLLGGEISTLEVTCFNLRLNYWAWISIIIIRA